MESLEFRGKFLGTKHSHRVIVDIRMISLTQGNIRLIHEAIHQWENKAFSSAEKVYSLEVTD